MAAWPRFTMEDHRPTEAGLRLARVIRGASPANTRGDALALSEPGARPYAQELGTKTACAHAPTCFDPAIDILLVRLGAESPSSPSPALASAHPLGAVGASDAIEAYHPRPRSELMPINPRVGRNPRWEAVRRRPMPPLDAGQCEVARVPVPSKPGWLPRSRAALSSPSASSSGLLISRVISSYGLVELVVGHRLGRGGVEGGGLIFVVQRWATRVRERRGRSGQVEVLEDPHHAVGLDDKGDEVHFVAAMGAS